MKTLNLNRIVVTGLCLIALFNSCSKSSNVASSGDGKIAKMEFAISHSEYKAIKNFNRAATPYLTNDYEPQILRSTLDIGNDMLLIAELAPDEPRETPQANSAGGGYKAAIETEDLDGGIRYRVVVYDNTGAFVRQQEYIRGSEGSAPPMNLDGGQTYTFIVYSVNSSAALPGPTFIGGVQTLLTSELTVAGNQNFMYFRRDMTLVGGSTNRLDIVLKHQFSQITTIIDATQTGYNVTNITASFGPHSTTAIVSLETGLIVRGAQTARSSVTRSFSSGTASYATIINADENVLTNYVIASLTIGSLTMTNMTPFSNLTVSPGVKYNLTLRITPTDELITHGGLPAARINGQIWARHNLGVDTSLDPDAPMTVTRHGDFYQWGTAVRSGGPQANRANPFRSGNGPAANTWNFGTEQAPIKSIVDPCPANYRMPARLEFDALIQDTNPSNLGPFSGGGTLNSAKVLTSKRNASVKLTIPAQGLLSATGSSAPFGNFGSDSRGSIAWLWSSFSNSTVRGSRFRADVGTIYMLNHTANFSVRAFSLPIRCIAE